MERKPPSSLGDFLAVIQRRKYWIIVPFVLIVALVIVLGPYVPRTYQSTATIMLQPQQVPTAYVRPTTASDMMNRIQRIKLKLMSGPELGQIIEKMDLYPAMRKKAKMSRVIAAMSRDITVAAAPDSSDGHGGVNAFTVSYIGRTPLETQLVTQEIADLFVSENLKEGHQQAQGTSAFINAQVVQAAQQLAAQQAKIQAFKDAHLGSLPEQTQANIGLIGQYQAELQANNAALDQDNQQRVYLESVLNVSPAPGGSKAAAAPAVPTALQVELAGKQAELHADLLKYTPQHPDVIRLEHAIAALKVQISRAPKSSAVAPVVTPTSSAAGPSMNDQLRSQLVALNAEIGTRQARQTQIEQKLNKLQGAISTAPSVQTQFASLDSTYQEMQKNYNALLGKRQDASMAAQLAQSSDSEQFTVITPAGLPLAPYRPNPILLYMGAVIAGLFVGLLFALVVELRDDTMHSSNEVASYLKLPVIVDLPKCPPFSEEKWKISPSTAKS